MARFVGRVASGWPRALRSAARRMITFLGKPGWQGWGTILTFFSVLATMAVAVMLFRFTEEEEQRRYEESRAEEQRRYEASRANFLAGGEIWRNNDAEGPERSWHVDLKLLNAGPATARGVRVALVTGGRGIRPLDHPTAWKGDAALHVIFEGSVSAYSGATRVCDNSRHAILVVDDVFPGDSINISQRFAVEPGRDVELREAEIWPEVYFDMLGAEFSLAAAPPYLAHPVRAFVSLSIVGDNVDFEEWQPEASCPEEG